MRASVSRCVHGPRIALGVWRVRCGFPARVSMLSCLFSAALFFQHSVFLLARFWPDVGSPLASNHVFSPDSAQIRDTSNRAETCTQCKPWHAQSTPQVIRWHSQPFDLEVSKGHVTEICTAACGWPSGARALNTAPNDLQASDLTFPALAIWP